MADSASFTYRAGTSDIQEMDGTKELSKTISLFSTSTFQINIKQLYKNADPLHVPLLAGERFL